MIVEGPDPNHCFAIPSLAVETGDGRTVDLSAFGGRPLILACCASTGASVAGFLQDLSSHAEEVAAFDAWAVGIVDDPGPLEADDELRVLLARDPDGKLHAAFREHLAAEGSELGTDFVFLFGRGGNLQRYWSSHPSAGEVIEELARRR